MFTKFKVYSIRDFASCFSHYNKKNFFFFNFLKKIIKLNLLSFTQDALIKLVLNAILTEEMNISPNSQYILQKKKKKLPKMTA